MKIYKLLNSERPKRQNSVSAETEISAKLTESSAEISAEILTKRYCENGSNSWEKFQYGLSFICGNNPTNSI